MTDPQPQSDVDRAAEATEVTVDTSEYSSGEPQGNAVFSFRFGAEDDAEVLRYSDDYARAVDRAREDARQKGVAVLYLVDNEA